MSERKALFPFYIPAVAAEALASQHSEFTSAYARERRFTTITDFRVDGRVEADKTLHLNAWIATDNGFCQTAGTIWQHVQQLDDNNFESLVKREIIARASAELMEEDNNAFLARVQERAAKIRKELGL